MSISMLSPEAEFAEVGERNCYAASQAATAVYDHVIGVNDIKHGICYWFPEDRKWRTIESGHGPNLVWKPHFCRRSHQHRYVRNLVPTRILREDLRFIAMD